MTTKEQREKGFHYADAAIDSLRAEGSAYLMTIRFEVRESCGSDEIDEVLDGLRTIGSATISAIERTTWTD